MSKTNVQIKKVKSNPDKQGRVVTKISLTDLVFGEFLNQIKIKSIVIEMEADQSPIDDLALSIGSFFQNNLSTKN